MEAAERTELDRIIFFSDGVFAIAITLLVISIRVPSLPSDVANAELARHLIDEWPRILSYAISFAVIGLYWIGHHRAFAHIRRFDHRLIVFNLVFLGLIAFQPWPTAVLGSIPIAYVSPLAAQLSWLSFAALRRVVERRYGGDDTREGAFA